jgi:hypothetical protein
MAQRRRGSAATRRITANLPVDVLEAARAETGKGITETLVEGLDLLRRRRAARKFLKLAGTLQLDVDLEGSRERHRR